MECIQYNSAYVIEDCNIIVVLIIYVEIRAIQNRDFFPFWLQHGLSDSFLYLLRDMHLCASFMRFFEPIMVCIYTKHRHFIGTSWKQSQYSSFPNFGLSCQPFFLGGFSRLSGQIEPILENCARAPSEKVRL